MKEINKISQDEITKLIEYLNKESDNGEKHTEFRLVAGYLPGKKCYIHVHGRDSTSLDFELPDTK